MAVQPSLDRARGEARADSDVDVAVLVRPEMPPEDYLAVSLRLARRLESALRERVDAVTVLNEAPLRLQYRVLRDGVTLHGGRPRRPPRSPRPRDR